MTNDSLIQSLNDLLADQAVYYQKLRNYHWNVTGPAFFQLHVKFEEMYLAAQEHVDTIAERILALGGHPRSTMRQFLESSRISEDNETPPARSMVENLRADIQTLHENNRTVRSHADELGDETTVNMLDDIAEMQSKDSWMFRAWLG